MISKFYILSVIILLCSLKTRAQNDTTIYMEEIGWLISLPNDYKISNNDIISKTVHTKTLLTVIDAAGIFSMFPVIPQTN